MAVAKRKRRKIGAAALKRIAAEAKRIYARKGRKGIASWHAAQREAGRKLRGKAGTKRKAGRRRVSPLRRKSVVRKGLKQRARRRIGCAASKRRMAAPKAPKGKRCGHIFKRKGVYWRIVGKGTRRRSSACAAPRGRRRARRRCA